MWSFSRDVRSKGQTRMALVLATARSRMRRDAGIFCRPGFRQCDEFEMGARSQFGINIDVDVAYVPAIPVSLN